MIFYVICVVIIALLFVGYREKSTNKFCTSKKQLHGRTVLVTGGTSGMGLEMATDFAERGARVIVACPFPDQGHAARETIIEKSGNNNVYFKLLDLTSLASVRSFADEINKTEEQLDILLNNAGLNTLNDYLTEDGMSCVMQINYFGHFLLTLLLLPLLRKSGSSEEPARIINTASVLHNLGRMDFDNWNRINYWYSTILYGNSKLCLALFTRELSRRLKGVNVIVNSIDPGFVGTTIFKEWLGLIGILVILFARTFFKNPWEGAQTALHVALDKEAGTVSGEYFKNCALSKASCAAYNDVVGKRLWKESMSLVGLSEDKIKQLMS